MTHRIEPSLVAVTRAGHSTWLAFKRAEVLVEARSLDEVPELLESLQWASKEGLWGVGYLTYEAASGCDSKLETYPGRAPVGWFALCPEPEELADDELPPTGDYRVGPWTPSIAADQHRQGIAEIKRRIESGETYQVNYTHTLEAHFAGSSWAYFRHLFELQPTPYATWINSEDRAICSVSPELFFSLDDSELTCRPMKGTRPRGRFAAEDRALLAELRSSTKDQAENLMIVDMIRNDLGRVARPGSVETTALFETEVHPSVLQLTSTVRAKTDRSLSEILRALFPCASITGAPKRSTMGIIRKLEAEPRGIYTGAIGWVAPQRRARFSVAIRTAEVLPEEETIRYGTGGGIVWESNANAEYSECQTKTRLLQQKPRKFSLLETMRWDPREGTPLLERHLDRLRASADYFDFRFDEGSIRDRIARAADGLPDASKLRLLLARNGSVDIEIHPLGLPVEPWKLALSTLPVESDDPFLFHKTTARDCYEAPLVATREKHPEIDDVLLWNEQGQLTETTIANLVLVLDGEPVTPPRSSGLLAGTLREELLETERLRERTLNIEDLKRASEFYLINSVRGRFKATLV